MKAFRMSRAAVALTVLSAMVATAVASVVSTSATFPVPGVTSSGSPSTDVTGVGSGKFYKDTHSGIITGTFVAKILNKSKASAKFENQGLSITDPWTGDVHTATSDVEIVSKPISFWSKASLTVTWNPLVALED